MEALLSGLALSSPKRQWIWMNLSLHHFADKEKLSSATGDNSSESPEIS